MANLVAVSCAGIAAVLAALAALITALKARQDIRDVGQQINGRIDQLLDERERRVRAEHAAQLERERLSSIQPLARTARPLPHVEQRPPNEPHQE